MLGNENEKAKGGIKQPRLRLLLLWLFLLLPADESCQRHLPHTLHAASRTLLLRVFTCWISRGSLPQNPTRQQSALI